MGAVRHTATLPIIIPNTNAPTIAAAIPAIAQADIAVGDGGHATAARSEEMEVSV